MKTTPLNLQPVYPIELPAGIYPAKQFQIIYDDVTLIQMKYDSLKPPYLQQLIHTFTNGFIWQ